MDKRTARRAILDRLKTLPAGAKQLADACLMERLLASSAYQEAMVLATYLPLPHEVDNRLLLQQAKRDGKQVLVPKILGPGQMVFVPYEADRLRQGPMGILEPTDSLEVAPQAIDLIHVPGLLFNRQGYRIGYGGGFYDRYLAQFSGAAVATLYACQLVEFMPDDHDHPVKELLIDDTLH